MNAQYRYDVVVIGGGPAGLTAAIFTSRAGLKTIVLEAKTPGGRLSIAPSIDNYPGFPQPVKGSELAMKIYQHAIQAGAEVEMFKEVAAANFKGLWKSVITRDGEMYSGLAVVLATGVALKRGLISGEEGMLGKGVSYCAVCDGPLYKGMPVAVIGHDERTFKEAIFLADIVSKVFLVTHGEVEEDDRPFLEYILKRDNVELIKGRALEIIGKDEVEGVKVKEASGERIVPVKAVFILLEEVPVTTVFSAAGIETDEKGFIKVDSRCKTNLEGVYAAGDVTGIGFQVATAIGQGALAGLEAASYVRKMKKKAISKP